MKAWEQRERKKKSDYELEKRRELTRLHEEEKEGKRLLAFFEDYNDENDDPKYYKYVPRQTNFRSIFLGFFLEVHLSLVV